MQVELKLLDPRLKSWGFPHYGSDLASGMDVFACVDAEVSIQPQSAPVLIPLGFSLHIENPDWCALLVPRSGAAHRDGLLLGNAVGVIDPDYTGQCFASVWNRNTPSGDHPLAPLVIRPGGRIAQLLFIRTTRPSWKVVEEFTNSSGRRDQGFGSTG